MTSVEKISHRSKLSDRRKILHRRKMLLFIQISLTNIYTHLGETCHKYSITIYQCLYYVEDQSIHIYGTIGRSYNCIYFVP